MSNTVTDKLEDLLWGPQVGSLSLLPRLGVKFVRFVYAVIRDMIAENLTLRAMGLVYITILSIVPVIAISFSILKGFGYHHKLEPLLNNFLLPMGDKGVELTNKLIEFVDNVQGNVLAGVGLVLLFVTTISMAQKVENSLNHIWRVDRPRNLARRWSEYLSVIMVGPVVMVTALALIATVKSNSVVQEISAFGPISKTLLSLSQLSPYLLMVMAFTFVYWFLPNTRVKLSAAFIGGLTGGVLWAGTGILFATFVANSTRTFSIYTTFAIVIIALIWLYLVWLILLVGSQVAFYIQNPEQLRLGYQRPNIGGRQREEIALSLMCKAAAAFRAGSGQPTLGEVADAIQLPNLLLVPIVERLAAAGLLARSTKDRLFPQHDPNQITVTEIIAAVRETQSSDIFPEGHWPSPVDNVSRRIDTAVQDALGDQSLYELLDTGEEEIEEHGIDTAATDPLLSDKLSPGKMKPH